MSTMKIQAGATATLSGTNLLASSYELNDNTHLTIADSEITSRWQSNSKFTYVGTDSSFTMKNVTAKLEFEGNAILHNENVNLSIIDAKIENVTSNTTGGAIVNESGRTISTLTGTFTSNSAQYSDGGAIYNEGTIGELAGTFTGNSASGNGGAIYNGSGATLTIVANEELGDTKFSENTANGVSNAIYNAGTLNLNASGTKTITFDDAISGDSGTININASGTTGTVYFNADVSGNTVNLFAGTLVIGENATVDNLVVNSATAKIVLDGKIENVSVSGTGKLIIEQSENAEFSVSVGAGTTFTAGTDESAVTLTSASAITVNKVAELNTENVSVKNADGVAMNVLAAWSFGIEKDADAEVTVEMQLASGLDANEIVIFHLDDASGSKWTDYSSQISNKNYDSSTGTLSFTTKSFSSYAAAVIPEPSSFGLLAGTLALLLAGTRRRRK